jgi:carboxyl-terminal processing protease
MSEIQEFDGNRPQGMNTKRQIALPLVLALGLAGGVFIGTTLNTKSSREVSAEVQKFKEVLTRINESYVDEVNTQELVDEAITHMLTNLDPHSTYILARDKEFANEDLRGNFDGIGIEFKIFNDTIVVVTPLSGGPSEAIGIKPGDKIVEVNDTIVAGIGINTNDVMRYLKGPKGTKVKVGIARRGQSKLLEYNIVRDKIPQYSVDVSYMVKEDVGYIKVNRFAATTFDEFSAAMTKLKEQGMKRLILDLQGNPGGYMNIAIDMADEFLEAGKKIVFTKGKNGRYDQYAEATDKGSFAKGDLIILINEGSASASEIVTGALQDNDRALVVGRRSFGKGLVQNPFDLSDGSELRLTISRYYTPSGRSIQKPYENGDEYAQDMVSRYNHGEFFHSDSIQLIDSLKYLTSSGRTVYGGGGIMPDYFVPLDTVLNSHYLNELYTSYALFEYAFYYAERNKSSLEQMGYEHFRSGFHVSDGMYEELMKMGARSGVKPNAKDLYAHRNLFELHLKAQIAKSVWGNDGFYPIFNETNEVLQAALELLDKAPELNRLKL